MQYFTLVVVDDGVRSGLSTEDEGVFAATTFQFIITGTAVEHVVVAFALKDIVAGFGAGGQARPFGRQATERDRQAFRGVCVDQGSRDIEGQRL